jgi:hypothetical protein
MSFKGRHTHKIKMIGMLNRTQVGDQEQVPIKLVIRITGLHILVVLVGQNGLPPWPEQTK